MQKNVALLLAYKNCGGKVCMRMLVILLVSIHSFPLFAQTDSVKKVTLDSFIRRQRGFIGKLGKGILADTSLDNTASPRVQRNDAAFQQYRGLVIRHIVIKVLDFGISIGDTTKAMNNKLTRLVNNLHTNTTERTIRRNIFFRSGTPLSPFLLGANERHLRDLRFIQDAKITVQQLAPGSDSADIFILTKDVYSLGGGANMSRINRIELAVQEDNLGGGGNQIQLQTLFDSERKRTFGFGAQYIQRNISGSFIDGYVGYKNFSPSFSTGKREEQTTYLRFIKPLVHPYMKWTYALEASLNKTVNMYDTDSVYQKDARYDYNSVDAWVGWNINGDELWEANNEERLNWLVSLRVFRRDFETLPENIRDKYFQRYVDFAGVLGAVSIFKQTFYKTQFIYGFGRNEDVPEGVDFSFTAGYTIKDKRKRPYAGLDYQRYFFTPQEHYVSLVVRGGGFIHKRKFEDVALLAGIDYFSRLQTLNKRWKQRTFLAASVGRQIGFQLNDPLLLESKWGLEGFENDNIGGTLRLSGKAESVFYSPWSPLLFKLAPFVFAGATVFESTNTRNKPKLYSAVGGGIRTRNESLVFGTIEVRGTYYPKPNFYNDHWRISFIGNLRFTYNKQFIKRPELVVLN